METPSHKTIALIAFTGLIAIIFITIIIGSAFYKYKNTNHGLEDTHLNCVIYPKNTNYLLCKIKG